MRKNNRKGAERMKYRIKLFFSNGKEPLVSLIRHEKPTEEEIKKAVDLYEADDYEILEEEAQY